MSKKHWASGYLMTLTIDAIMIASFIAWQVHDVHPAGGVFQAFNWILTLMTVVASLSWIHESQTPVVPTGRLWKAYTFVRLWAKVLAFSWTGLFWLLGVYVIGQLLLFAAHEAAKTPKTTVSGAEPGQ
jgi:hypothetical protein